MPASYFQTTLEKPVTFSGVGVHSAVPCSVVIQPAPAHTGIVFIRSDLPSLPHIQASYKNVSSTERATTLSTEDGVSVSTVEHILAALRGLNVDNAFVLTSAEELPILDGSAAPFCKLIEQARIKTLKAPRRFIQILSPIEIEEGNRFVSLTPASSFSMDIEISFRHHSGLPPQKYAYLHSSSSFVHEIAPARTYGFYEDVDHLRKNGLALGSSLENALVFHEGEVMNPEGLRYDNECVRHKVLDVIGDLSLSGYPILGYFQGISPGHELNNRLVQKLMKNKLAWQFTTSSLTASPPLRAPSPSSLREEIFSQAASLA